MLFGVFDTETTGLPYHRDADLGLQPRVIEFGGILTDGTEIIEETSFICNPGIEIEKVITDITGLTNDDLKDQPRFEHFVPQLRDYFCQADVIIAHNLSFDKSMIKYDMARLGQELYDAYWINQIEVCTVEQSFHRFGRRMRLTELYNMLVETYVQKHRALDDVRCLHAICQKLGVYEAFKSMEGQS